MRPATIAKLQVNGSSSAIWTTTDAGANGHKSLLSTAMATDKISDPGIYLVATVSNGIASISAFTIKRLRDGLTLEPGIQQSVRVNRWPPKP